MRKLFTKKRILIAAVAIVFIFIAIPLPSPLFPDNYSTVVLAEPESDTDLRQSILRVFLNKDEQWIVPPNPDLIIPRKLRTAVLQYEDRYFDYHPGVNPAAILRAISQNLSTGKTISGASTITMQVARLMKPKPRTYLNKALEVLQAIKIEMLYSKIEILNFYVNHAPYGGNIIGFQAASLRYFQKLPEQLTWSEAATLAVLPNAPGLISPDINPGRLRQKRDTLLKELRKASFIDEEAYQLALLEPMPDGSKPFQLLAPHLSQKLKNQQKTSGGIIATTIQASHQERCEELVKRHLTYLKQQGIHNGAVLVAETKTGKIRAYVGSQDFFDFEQKGQVDGVTAPRSSGSLLKPFLYALAMDEGIILPQTLVKDVPTFYGAFSPANADESFDGILPASESLVRSLNVPAVRLLYTYGVHPFYHFLQSAQLSTLFRTPDDYGLPLIIGGAEVTAWDMAMLFRGLGNNGRFSPLQIFANGTDNLRLRTSEAVLSPAASYLTLNMLRELKRPGSEYYWEQFENQWPLAWKTGTSYGQRDAWAVGVSPEWTIACWVGNFSGEGNANLSGARCAGPLLFDIFNYLPKDPAESWFEKPAGDFSPLNICLETGFLASRNCPNPTIADAPSHMKPLRLCPYHFKAFLSEDDAHQVCSLCWKSGKYKAVEALIYPPDVEQYLRQRGQVISTVPSHKPDCPVQAGNLPIQIIYPQENARLWVPRDFGGDLQMVTMRVAHRESKRQLFWYLDDHYLGMTERRHEKAVDLTKGWHVLEVIDDVGYRDRKRFYVDMKN